MNRSSLTANADGILRIVAIGRLSRAQAREAETQEALESLRRETERLIDTFVPEPKTITHLMVQAGGKKVDRETMRELDRLIAGKECDVIFLEDLSRLCRDVCQQWAFIEKAAGAGIRVVSADGWLDTAEPLWTVKMTIAAVRHSTFREQMRRRVLRKRNAASRRDTNRDC